MRTVGWCRSFATIWLVSASTARRWLGQSDARRPSARSSSARPLASACTRGEAALGPLQLGLSDGLGLRPKRGDRRHDVERRLPGAEAVGLVAHDRLRARGLLAAAGDALGDDPLEVVDVVEVAALQVVDRGI